MRRLFGRCAISPNLEEGNTPGWLGGTRIGVSQKYAPLISCLTNVGSLSCSQQPSTRDSAMSNSKETNFAAIQPMYFCPYCLGSVLVEFNNTIVIC